MLVPWVLMLLVVQLAGSEPQRKMSLVKYAFTPALMADQEGGMVPVRPKLFPSHR